MNTFVSFETIFKRRGEKFPLSDLEKLIGCDLVIESIWGHTSFHNILDVKINQCDDGLAERIDIKHIEGINFILSNDKRAYKIIRKLINTKILDYKL